MRFHISKEKIKDLYRSKGNNGCFVSNRILTDGSKVGYMYREYGDHSFPDSGWRFLAGDETEQYLENPENFSIVNLNTVCNYDVEIIPYLEYPYGSAFIRVENHFEVDTI